MSRPEPDSWNRARGAEIYADVVRQGVLHRTLARRLADLLAPRPGARLLDLGAGSGLVTEVVFARVGREGRVVGLDHARAMLQVAARSASAAGVSFVVGDPGAAPLADGSFDGALCSAAFWHFPAPARVFAELARLLVGGGRFAFNVPAAQLTDVEDVAPAPLQLVLAREGERLFGSTPSPGGPAVPRAALLDPAQAAGLSLIAETQSEIAVQQRELVDLLAVPAIGARLYDAAPPEQRDALFATAAARVDLAEIVPCRWCEFLVQKR